MGQSDLALQVFALHLQHRLGHQAHLIALGAGRYLVELAPRLCGRRLSLGQLLSEGVPSAA